MVEVEEAKSTKTKTPTQYRRLNRFDIVEICETKKLVTKKIPVKDFLPAEEIFEVLQAAHLVLGHGGRDKLKQETSKKYANVTTEVINIFLSMCEICQLKKSKKKKGFVSEPIIHSAMNDQGQVDLIDMQSIADREYRFIMIYQDHLTKFVLLRALRTKSAEEVAHHLMDIFLTFGAPCILHSNNGKEFVNSVIKELSSMWLELKLVNGKPKHCQDSVDRTNQDIETMLTSWMLENKTSKWSNGLKFVQFMKNRAFHSEMKQSPYRAMFGMDPKVGLASLNFTKDVLENIKEEDDLERIIEAKVKVESEMYENSAEKNVVPTTEGICSKIVIKSVKRKAHENLSIQTKKMKHVPDATHPPVEVGSNVLNPIPVVDKVKADFQNIIGVLEKNVLEKKLRST